MKTNHVPRATRLLQRIYKLEELSSTSMARRGSNPYPICRHCNFSIVEVNLRDHGKGCPVRGVEKQIAYYRSLI
jgi:hypothetical protein